jgi:hypothetical protein
MNIQSVKLTDTGNYIVTLNDGSVVGAPNAPGNRYYEAVQEWIALGNTPDAADVPPAPTYKELRAAEYNLKSTGEQFGMQYDDAKNSTTTWVDWQTEIKVRIPE